MLHISSTTVGRLLFNEVEAASLFRVIVMPLSIVAIIVGVIGRRDDNVQEGLNQRKALWGIILGGISLGIVVIAMIIVVVIFAPMLEA